MKRSKKRVHFISNIVFGVKSADEIKRQAVCEIKDITIYNKNKPRPHAINDHRMGTVDRRIPCGTCGHNVETCPGHVGYIKLATPLYNVGFLDTVLRILRSVCYFCSEVMVPPEIRSKVVHQLSSFPARTNFARKYSTICWSCGGKRPIYKRFTSKQIVTIQRIWPDSAHETFKDDQERLYALQPFTSQLVWDILRTISDESCTFLGLDVHETRPESFITTILLVPPPSIRPAIMVSGGSRSRGQDDLTRKLQDILKQNQVVEEMLRRTHHNYSDKLVQKAIQELQYHYAVYINNDLKGMKQDTQRSGAPIKGITQRIKGKQGLIRTNLMGKRVDFSNRSVITADPTLDVDEVGVPPYIAMLQTIPEQVTLGNMQQILEYIRNGPTRLNGALMVEYPNGRQKYLSAVRDLSTFRVPVNSIVHRFLRDGDYVIFNRHPSLHKHSLMGHRVRIMPHSNTFRMNLACTTPYNADFDGDEMNIHVVQNPEAAYEVKEIMGVDKNVLDPQCNKPSMGLVQDGPLGAYLFTRHYTRLDRGTAMSVFMQVKSTSHAVFPEPDNIDDDPRSHSYTGKQLISSILPRFSLRKHVRNRSSNPDDECVVHIENGTLLSGALCKETVGRSPGGIIHIIALDYDGKQACMFMSDVQRMLNDWLMRRGFSMGLEDCMIHPEQKRQIQERIQVHFQNIKRIQNHFQALEYVGKDEVEMMIFGTLSEVLHDTSQIINQHLTDDNSIYAMVTSGSKGNFINISQIMGCVGQQSVEGKRIHSINKSRVLSCFNPGDNDPRAHGFITSSYIQGLNPREFFFHAMGGREGLVDTAVKTADTGYLQRRMTKAMESMRISQDGKSVCDEEGNIVDFMYGGDGLDATFIESKYNMEFLSWSDQELRDYLKNEDGTVIPEELDVMKTLIEKVIQSKLTVLTPELDPYVFVPVCIKRVLETAETEPTEFLGQNNYSTYYDTTYQPHTPPMSPTYNPTTPPMSPTYNPTTPPMSPTYNPTSPPMSPAYNPTSPTYNPTSPPMSPAYNPTSPTYNPTSPPMSPAYNPTSPPLDPVNPTSPPMSPAYNPTSPTYNPTSPPISPAYNPTSPPLDPVNPTSPTYNPTSPPMSPAYNPISPPLDPVNPMSPPMSPTYNPTSTVSRVDWGAVSPSSVSPQKVFEDVCALCAEFSHSVYFQAILHFELASSRISQRFNYSQWQFIQNRIREKYYRARIKCGTMVGPLSAESLGQPATQMTLNSILGDELIMVRSQCGVHIYEIGHWIDYLMSTNARKIHHIRENRTEYLKLDVPFQVQTSSNQGEFSWSPITAVTRHLPGNGIVRFTTASGRSCAVTRSKSVLVWNEAAREFEPRRGDQLHVGDYVPTLMHMSSFPSTTTTQYDGVPLSYELGVEVGMYLVDPSYQAHSSRLIRHWVGDYSQTQHLIPPREMFCGPQQFRDGVWSVVRRAPCVPTKAVALAVAQLATYYDTFVILKCCGSSYELTFRPFSHVSSSDRTHRHVLLDRVVDLVDVKCDLRQTHVYDLTVPSTLNFALMGGLVVRDTFHYAGCAAKNVTLGVPRFKELVDLTKTMRIPSLTIFLREPYNSHENAAHNFCQSLIRTHLEDVVQRCDVFFDPHLTSTVSTNRTDQIIVDQAQPFLRSVRTRYCKWVTRLELVKRNILTNNMKLEDIVDAIQARVGQNALVLSSTTVMEDWVVIVRIMDVSEMVRRLSNKTHVQNLERSLTQSFQAMLLKEVIIGGIKGIRNAHIRRIDTHQNTFPVAPRSRWIIDTEGSALTSIFVLPVVDWQWTYSNDVNEVCEVLGLEAALHVLFKEIKDVLSFDGSYVNERHISMVVNTMSHRGYLMPLNRFGMNRLHTSVLKKASYEESMDMLLEASVFGYKDQIRGVSERIMVGRKPDIGTHQALNAKVDSKNPDIHHHPFYVNYNNIYIQPPPTLTDIVKTRVSYTWLEDLTIQKIPSRAGRNEDGSVDDVWTDLSTPPPQTFSQFQKAVLSSPPLVPTTSNYYEHGSGLLPVPTTETPFYTQDSPMYEKNQYGGCRLVDIENTGSDTIDPAKLDMVMGLFAPSSPGKSVPDLSRFNTSMWNFFRPSSPIKFML